MTTKTERSPNDLRALRTHRSGLPTTVLAAALLTVTGCATMSEQLARTEVETLKSYPRQIDTEHVLVVARQSGATLTLHTARECRRVTSYERRETRHYEKENQDSAGDYTSLVFGLAFGGAGSALLVDASQAGLSNEAHERFGLLNAKQEFGIGVAAAALGGLLVTIPVVDGIRALQSREDVREYQEDGPTVVTSEACGFQTRPPDAVPIAAGSLDSELALALQDGREIARSTVRLFATGETPLELAPLLPDSLLRSARRPSRLRVALGTTMLAEFDALPAYRVRDDSAWIALGTARTTCASARSLDACDEVSAFAQRYPDGAYRTAALALVANAEPTFAALRDDRDFATADAAACRAAESEEACDGVKSYLERRPSGRHRGEAAAALAVGTPKVAALVRQREAEEAEAKRRHDAEEAREAEERRREEAREAEERRREEARERVEAARRRNGGGWAPAGRTCTLWRNAGRGVGQGTVCATASPFVRSVSLGPCRCPN